MMDAMIEATIRELVAYADSRPLGGLSALQLVNAMVDDQLDPEIHADLDEITCDVNLHELIVAMEKSQDIGNE
jgi:hypothetical protein